MAPFRNAMCFINRNSGELALIVNRLQMCSKGFGKRIFWRYVQQSGQRVPYRGKSGTRRFLHSEIGIPHLRSSMIAFLSEYGVLELSVATTIFAA